MAKALTVAELVTEVRRDIDETTAATSYFSDADIVAYINRTLEWVGNGMPIRSVVWTVTGDASTVDFDSPEQVSDFHIANASTHPQPRVSFAASTRETGIIHLLNNWITSYGFSVRLVGDRIRLRIQPAIDSGEERTFHFLGLLGTVKETPYSTGTVSITLDSDTITGSGTTWTTNAAPGDAITINNEYYLVKSVTDNTTLVLTEVAREATASGLSYEIGGSTGLPASFNSLMQFGVQWRLEKKRKNPDWQTTRELAKKEFWVQSAYLENIMAPNHNLGLAL